MNQAIEEINNELSSVRKKIYNKLESIQMGVNYSVSHPLQRISSNVLWDIDEIEDLVLKSRSLSRELLKAKEKEVTK